MYIFTENRVKMELADLHKEITNTNSAIDKLKKLKMEMQFDLENNIIPQLQLYQSR